jgi:hypothetical protein
VEVDSYSVRGSSYSAAALDSRLRDGDNLKYRDEAQSLRHQETESSVSWTRDSDTVLAEARVPIPIGADI